MDEVALQAASEKDAELLGNLLNLYVHDMSEIFGFEPQPDGRFVYDRLPLYWSEPATRFAFLIRVAGRVAGFALVTRGSPASDDPNALDLAEFFVLRAFRRSQVGRAAAIQLWNRLRGAWVVRVAEANRAGVPFWESTVREYTNGAFATSALVGRQERTFRVFTFESASG